MLPTLIQQYKTDGYYIARNLLPVSLIEKTLFDMDRIVVQQLHRLGTRDSISSEIEVIHEHMRKLFNKDQFSYLQAIRLWPRLFLIHSLIMNEDILAVAKTLGIDLPIFQTLPVIHVMANDLKITGGYHGVGVHQDWPALQSGLDTLTIWFPFMLVDQSNFPLEILPGSHRHGLYPGKITDNIFEIDTTEYDEKDFIPMELNRGDVLFMSNFTLHRSSTNGDHRLRVACSARYENGSEKTFIDRIYPSCQKRVIERELMEPNFPLKLHLDEIFNIE